MDNKKQCPHCGDSDLVIVDKHPGTITSDPEGTNLKYHHIYKCNKCNATSKDCDKFLDMLVYVSIEGLNIDAIKKEHCEYIESHDVFMLARILYLIRERKFENAIKYITQLENNINDLKTLIINQKNNILLIKAFLLYKLGNQKGVREILKGLSPDINSSHPSTLFVNQLLNILIEDNIESYNSFIEYWFDDFNIPFEIVEFPEVYEGHRIFIEKNIEYLFTIKGFFELIPISLLEDAIRKYSVWSKISNDKIIFLDQVVKTVHSIEIEYSHYCANMRKQYEKRILDKFSKVDNPDSNDYSEDININSLKSYKSYSNIIWYKNIKGLKDQLYFDLYIYNEKYEDAFEYYETEGVSHINGKKNVGYDTIDDEDDLFVLTPELFPTYFNPEDWLPHEDMHEVTYLGYYSEVWERVLRYLTIVHFYKGQLKNHPKQIQDIIKDRIIFVTEKYMEDEFLNREVHRRRLPPFVADIYEERNEWEKAYDAMKNTNIKEGNKQKKYTVDGELFNCVKHLPNVDQRQVLVYIKLILQLEPELRKFIRRILRGLDPQKIISKYFPDIEKRIKRDKRTIITRTGDDRQDELDWLTFPELYVLITHTDLMLYKILEIAIEQIQAAKAVLSPIRNNIAHAIKVTDTDIDIAVKYVDNILSALNKVKVR
jgi:hypothetical protein